MALTYKIIEQTTQAGGVQRVQAVFTDEYNLEHRRQYDFQKGADVDAELKVRACHVENGLIEREKGELVGKVEKGESIGTPKYCLIEDVKVALLTRKAGNLVEINNLTTKNTYLETEAK